MTPTGQGSIRLFRIAGIDLFLHWSWFVVAVFEVSNRARSYSSITWNVLEYLALFAVVMLHELGHALACRQVGGRANQIVLWPLGGVAYVDPPPRPGATLWSVAAGPLVNVALLPVLTLLVMLSSASGGAAAAPNAHALLRTIWVINLGLLLFNLLPIYPLDGGQILRSLLWFVLGRARSLMAATVIGFIGVGGLVLVALWMRSIWIGVLSAFILMNCWQGLLHARRLYRVESGPRHDGFRCPSCRTAPLQQASGVCGRCGERFDVFASLATCPRCAAQYSVVRCPECGEPSPIAAWLVPPTT